MCIRDSSVEDHSRTVRVKISALEITADLLNLEPAGGEDREELLLFVDSYRFPIAAVLSANGIQQVDSLVDTSGLIVEPALFPDFEETLCSQTLGDGRDGAEWIDQVDEEASRGAENAGDLFDDHQGALLGFKVAEAGEKI